MSRFHARPPDVTDRNAAIADPIAIRPPHDDERADRRGTGLGDSLVRAVEGFARSRQLNQLVLLTQTAARFFAARGFTAIDRAAAPTAVQGSAEFAPICPASATCMAKLLSP